MTMEDAHAVGQDGTKAVPTAQAGAVAPASQPHTRAELDDAYRQIAIEELALHLSRGSALLQRCDEMSREYRSDQVGAVHAAARLMNANAQLAKALAQLALVERRSRTIVETIQRPDPKNAGLNSILTSPQYSSPRQRRKIRDALERGLLQFLEEQKQDRERSEDLAVGCSI